MLPRPVVLFACALGGVAASGCLASVPAPRPLEQRHTPAARASKVAPLASTDASLREAIREAAERGPRAPQAVWSDLSTVAPLERDPMPPASLDRDGAARLPPETVRRVVRQRFGSLRGCYQRGLAKDPHLAGRFVVQFDIRPDGLVERARELEPSVPDRGVRGCLLQSFFDLRFPAAPSPTPGIRYALALGRGTADPKLSLGAATRAAEPPPPGFEEALTSGRPVTQEGSKPSSESAEGARASKPTACDPDDPLCDAL